VYFQYLNTTKYGEKRTYCYLKHYRFRAPCYSPLLLGRNISDVGSPKLIGTLGRFGVKTWAKESGHGGSADAKAAGNLLGLSQCDAVANGVDLYPLEHLNPIERDNVVLYGQYILDRKLVRRHRRAIRVVLNI